MKMIYELKCKSEEGPRSARGIGLLADETEFICSKEEGTISALCGRPLK